MPKVAYSNEEKEKVKEALIITGLKLMSEQGIQQTRIEQVYRQVGISRSFFYSFFPAKEELILEVIYYQQPKLIAHVQALVNESALDWKVQFRDFLYECCSNEVNRFAIMSVEEQQVLFKSLSKQRREEFREKQLKMFTQILRLFGLEIDEKRVKLLFNLVLSIIIVQRSIPNTLPFLFQEEAKTMLEVQCKGLIEYMENLKRSEQNGIIFKNV